MTLEVPLGAVVVVVVVVVGYVQAGGVDVVQERKQDGVKLLWEQGS